MGNYHLVPQNIQGPEGVVLSIVLNPRQASHPVLWHKPLATPTRALREHKPSVGHNEWPWVSAWKPSFRRNLQAQTRQSCLLSYPWGSGSAAAPGNPRCLPHKLLPSQRSILVLADAETAELWQVIIRLVSAND